ncbi:hypothetical protein CCHR01_06631 [Colletotrichum chrysophilum]|uniref:Uncharacterized protein n=1 Tax=Colletotrichum chrysophilum TaxID=1836956 RepID=A0AAD9ANN9_9PEZI|nr:hypothetical protein CCHR01_06631 [Colletotrichum chrysophilum]
MDYNSTHQSYGSRRNHASNTDEDAPRSDVWTKSSYSPRLGHSSEGTSGTGFTMYSGMIPQDSVVAATKKRGKRTYPSSRKQSVPAGSGERQGKQLTGPTLSEDDAGQSQKDFEMDPAHQFWKWSVESQNWYHLDESTGSVMWAPRQLD